MSKYSKKHQQSDYQPNPMNASEFMTGRGWSKTGFGPFQGNKVKPITCTLIERAGDFHICEFLLISI